MSALEFKGSLLDLAICMAVRYHAGLMDKAGLPYILHPLRVMSAVAPDEKRMIAAVLHDAIEDTELTLEEARGHFGDEVACLLDLLTRRKGEETYRQFIQRISCNETAKAIKIADLRDNLSRIDSLPLEQQSISKRYERALKDLGAA